MISTARIKKYIQKYSKKGKLYKGTPTKVIFSSKIQKRNRNSAKNK